MEKKDRKKLGRGIDVLIPQTITDKVDYFFENNDNTKVKIVNIPLDKIHTNPFQPRRYFNEERIKDLAESIKTHGVLEPLLVVQQEDDNFLIIAGERRYRASKLAEKKTIPSIILSIEEEQQLEISLIENIQREDLNPIEKANSFKDLLSISKSTQEELADRLGISRPVVANTIRLLNLSDPIQQAIIDGKITQSHARLLLSVDNTEKRDSLFLEVIHKELSVRSLENLLVQNTEQKNSHKEIQKNKDLTKYEEALITFFGTKVTLSGNINKGRISISYFNQDDLSRILDLLHVTIE